MNYAARFMLFISGQKYRRRPEYECVEGNKKQL